MLLQYRGPKTQTDTGEKPSRSSWTGTWQRPSCVTGRLSATELVRPFHFLDKRRHGELWKEASTLNMSGSGSSHAETMGFQTGCQSLFPPTASTALLSHLSQPPLSSTLMCSFLLCDDFNSFLKLHAATVTTCPLFLSPPLITGNTRYLPHSGWRAWRALAQAGHRGSSARRSSRFSRGDKQTRKRDAWILFTRLDDVTSYVSNSNTALLQTTGP